MHYFSTIIGTPVPLRAFAQYADGIPRTFVPPTWSCLDASVTLVPSSPPDGTCVATPTQVGYFTIRAHWTDPLGKAQASPFLLHADPVLDIFVPPNPFLGVTILPQ